MAGRAIPVQIGDIEVMVETTLVAGTEQTSRASDAAERVADAFDRAKETILAVAGSTVDLIEKAAARGTRPDHVQVEFGLKFSVKGTVIMAGASGEATLVVRLTYDAAPP